MLALRAELLVLVYLNHFTVAVRKIVQPKANDGPLQAAEPQNESLEEFLAKDWAEWALKEEAEANREEDEEYERIHGASMLDVNISWGSPCHGYTPCVHGRRGWTHACSEKIEHSKRETWQPVIQELSCVPVAFQAGDGEGKYLTFENYGRHMNRRFPTFSGGKRPGAVAAARAVMAGNLTWDTKANEVFDWWTKDGRDSRSRVTFASLLHFTSGFIVDSQCCDFDHNKQTHKCLSTHAGWTYSMEECAKQLYENTRHREPNTVFVYNSIHIQIAVAMAVKRSGLTGRQYLKENLYDPAGMTRTYYGGRDNPFIAAGMITTGTDYGNFLQSLSGYKIITKEIADVMEKEYRNAHHIPDIGRMVRWHDFAMSQATLEHFPECLNMGGAQQNCINRQGGTWWMLLPNPREYIGRANGMVSAEVILHAKDWIHDDLRRALSAAHGR